MYGYCALRVISIEGNDSMVSLFYSYANLQYPSFSVTQFQSFIGYIDETNTKIEITTGRVDFLNGDAINESDSNISIPFQGLYGTYHVLTLIPTDQIFSLIVGVQFKNGSQTSIYYNSQQTNSFSFMPISIFDASNPVDYQSDSPYPSVSISTNSLNVADNIKFTYQDIIELWTCLNYQFSYYGQTVYTTDLQTYQTQRFDNQDPFNPRLVYFNSPLNQTQSNNLVSGFQKHSIQLLSI